MIVPSAETIPWFEPKEIPVPRVLLPIEPPLIIAAPGAIIPLILRLPRTFPLIAINPLPAALPLALDWSPPPRLTLPMS
jgi:hypothetical protein